jgi:hypothetical protein
VQASLVSPRRSQPAADWLRSRPFDVALLVLVPALALALGGAAALFPAFFFYALTFDIWVLAYPHVTSTYTRIAFDRASARRHWFLLTGLPALVLGGTATIAALGGAGGLFTAYYVGQTYHYTRQSYGIARAYRRRGGASASTGLLSDAVIYAFPVWGLLRRAHQGHDVFYDNPLYLPRVPAFLVHGAGVIAWALFLVWAYRELRGLARGSGRYGHALFVSSHVLVTVVSYVLIGEITAGWLVVNLWHNAQYLLFVWGFNASRFRDGPDPASAFLSRLCQPRNAWVYALFCVAFGAALYAALDQLGARITMGAFPALLTLHLSVNFHHYLVDGVIWKSRRGQPPASA